MGTEHKVKVEPKDTMAQGEWENEKEYRMKSMARRMAMKRRPMKKFAITQTLDGFDLEYTETLDSHRVEVKMKVTPYEREKIDTMIIQKASNIEKSFSVLFEDILDLHL